MIYLSSNIRHLRKEKELTQAQLAAVLQLNRSIVGAYEEGRAEPKLKTLQLMAYYFKTTTDALMSKDLSNGDLPSIQKDISGEGLRLLPITIDRESDQETIPLVPVKAAAGYMNGYADIEFIERLPQFNMPFTELAHNKTYRIFQIKGESMLPVPDGSYIICEYLQDWQLLQNNQCYIINTIDDGVVYKRVINQIKSEGNLLLKSDNINFEPYVMPIENVSEIWKALGFVSFQLPDADVAQQMNMQQLVDVVVDLKKEIRELRSKK